MLLRPRGVPGEGQRHREEQNPIKDKRLGRELRGQSQVLPPVLTAVRRWGHSSLAAPHFPQALTRWPVREPSAPSLGSNGAGRQMVSSEDNMKYETGHWRRVNWCICQVLSAKFLQSVRTWREPKV